ncbi:MAG: hypothetical protein IPM68_07335 [Flavobacteriales bacterium]|nr:hypothetical protein [Flavobacteriales bacterium]
MMYACGTCAAQFHVDPVNSKDLEDITDQDIRLVRILNGEEHDVSEELDRLICHDFVTRDRVVLTANGCTMIADSVVTTFRADRCDE